MSFHQALYKFTLPNLIMTFRDLFSCTKNFFTGREFFHCFSLFRDNLNGGCRGSPVNCRGYPKITVTITTAIKIF